MRFAWLRTKEGREAPASTPAGRLTLIAYNVIWWIPAILPLIGVISYRAGFIAFLAVTVTRALINGYRINLIPVLAAERLPLRQPGA
jgi:hypothetical protein